MSMVEQIAKQTGLPAPGVAAAVNLFDEGATLPFVARYRKERTGSLDEVQLRTILDLRRQLAELDQRRQTILEALKGQGQLTEALRRALHLAQRKSELEDVYAPYKQGRKTRADIARARGLQPLADRIGQQPRDGHPRRDAQRFVRGEVGSVDEALKGAREIVAEHLAADPERRAATRRIVGQTGVLRSKVKKGQDASKFRDYADRSEPVRSIPPHRYLAMCRGEAEGVLAVKVEVDLAQLTPTLHRDVGVRTGSPYAAELQTAASDALKRLMVPTAVRAVRAVLKRDADDDAINVFQRNLEALLLSPPLGPEPVVGIDPGIRTGCKVAAVTATGDPIAHATVMLVGRASANTDALLAFLRRHRPHAVAVGNGTGGRETEALLRGLVRDHELPCLVVSVSEAGASVYSASELAGAELPDLDLTIRGAVSIARRLQDPLAELVKVDPKSIGVGQYQHDVDGARLAQRLDDVVESCVNRVGVDLNTASPSLLERVAGLGPKQAQAIADHRQRNGAFQRRRQLLKVAGLGPKTFEQCAAFLRIAGGPDPLDNSAVHPERYALVARMARDLGVSTGALVGSPRTAELQLARYVDAEVGLATLTDIRAELERPGRDPRERFEAPAFREDVHSLDDLQVGMVLAGVVTNVTNFGAFVDVGVHQDGLVHVSELADQFVRDPHEVVQPGKNVQVLVLEVDRDRNRVALSMKQAT